MTSEHLTAILVERVMGWSVAPDRFLMGNRRWIPRWRFRPEQNLSDAFQLLDAARPAHYAMGSDVPGEFWARVGIGNAMGEARHSSRAQAISLAVAAALGIDIGANG